MKYKIYTRYGGPGAPQPDVNTMCRGQCEGMGRVPISEYDTSEPWRTLWLEAEQKEHAEDGWHFVMCPDCNGTGKAAQKTKVD